MATVFGVSKSGFYKWIKSPVSDRERMNSWLREKIKNIFTKSKNTYGALRIRIELAKEGLSVSRKKVSKHMREEKLNPKAMRKFKVTTNSNHKKEISPNLLKDTVVEKPNQAWVSDITYVKTQEGWLYLSTVIDIFTRKVVGFATSDSLKAGIITKALWRAFKNNLPSRDLIFHSDKGSQYASSEVRRMLKDFNLKQSMSGTGNCYDNAFAESFFHTIKVELIYNENYKTRAEANASIFEYIETFYNSKRIHSGINYKTPNEFEMEFKEEQRLCA